MQTVLIWCVYQGSEASIVVEVKQLQRYPVDLYYLVDVSASMQENLDHVSVAAYSRGDCFNLNGGHDPDFVNYLV